MKKSTVAILVIILVLIFGVMHYLHVDVSKKIFNETISTAEGMMKINSRLSEIEEELGMHENDSSANESNTQNKNDVQFDSNKMKSDNTYVEYDLYEYDMGNSGLNIEIKEGKPYLSIDIEDEQYKFLFKNIENPIKNKELTGFKTDVKEVFYAYMGNGDPAPLILFLMDDGSVEYIDSWKIIENKEFESQGKVEELSNIVKFVELDASCFNENGEREGGFITAAAIDGEGYSFDLSQIIK